MSLLSKVGVLFHRCNGQNIFVIGAPIANIGDRPAQDSIMGLSCTYSSSLCELYSTPAVKGDKPCQRSLAPRDQLPLAGTDAFATHTRRTSQNMRDIMIRLDTLETSPDRVVRSDSGITAKQEIQQISAKYGVYFISPMMKVDSFSRNFIDNFPPCELHLELHGNAVMFLLLIANCKGEAWWQRALST